MNTHPSTEKVEQAYRLAKEQYANMGVDTEEVLDVLAKVPISLHCWQTDDVAGLEQSDRLLGGSGLQVTGNYPGKARNVHEMRQDLEKVLSLLPGTHRLNLHANYGEFGGKPVDRDQVAPEHFQGWVVWAVSNNLKLDFNSTLFSHPKTGTGFTLSSKDESIRQFWVRHVQQCREISAFMGRELGSACIHNIWIADGMKDTPIDRYGHRAQLKKSLDEAMEKPYDPQLMKDAVESKLFGIGSEAYVVGSHEFYLGYAIQNKKLICIDSGHFHPTEVVADKISSILQFADELLLHLTRGLRWDSDHVVTMNDDIVLICQEIVRAQALNRVHLGLDFFDASINRVGAYVTGTRAAIKSLLFALLEPVGQLKELENRGQYFQRLAMLEELKSAPFGQVWDYYCLKNDVPPGHGYIAEVEQYEQAVLSKRN
jgi:L-rhamnose isomerase